MDNLNFIKRFGISITSIKNYKYLLIEKFSKAITYLIILSLIMGVVQAIHIVKLFSTSEKIIEEFVIKEENKFSLENGVLEFENSPIEFEVGSVIVYIDTDIELESIDSIRSKLVHKDAAYAILKDGISIKEGDLTNTYKYEDIFMGLNIDNDSMLNSMPIVKVIKYIVAFMSIIFIGISFMIYSLIISILAIILSKINMLSLKYVDILKLSIYTSTFPMIIDSLISIGAFKIIISGVYLILIFKELKNLSME